MDDVSKGMTIKTELRAKVMKTGNKAEEHEGQSKDGLVVSGGPLLLPTSPFLPVLDFSLCFSASSFFFTSFLLKGKHKSHFGCSFSTFRESLLS